MENEMDTKGDNVLKKIFDVLFSRSTFLYISLAYVCYRFLLKNDLERFTQILYFLYSFGYLFYWLIKKPKIFLKKELIFSYMLLFFAIITLFINKSFDKYGIRALAMIIINFIAFFIYDEENEKVFDSLRIILICISIFCFICTFVSIVGAITDILQLTNFKCYYDNRFHGIRYVTYAGEIALMGFGASFLFCTNIDNNFSCNSKFKVFHIVNCIIQLFALFWAQSRCSMYGLVLAAICCLFIFIFYNRTNVKINKQVVITVLFCFIFILILLAILVKLRLLTLRKIGFYGSGRGGIWRAYLEVFLKQNIVFGIGPSKFVKLYRETLGFGGLEALNQYFKDTEIAKKHFAVLIYFVDLLTHNEFLREMILFGIVGLITFLVFIISILHKIFYILFSDKQKRYIGILLLACFYFIYPLFSALGENMFSITNSPRFIETYMFFYMSSVVCIVNDAMKKGVKNDIV